MMRYPVDKACCTLKMKAPRSFHTSVPIYKSTLRNIPEHSNLLHIALGIKALAVW